MNYKINYKDVKDTKIEHIIASSASKEGSKQLVVEVNLSNLYAYYKVLKNKVVVWESSFLKSAIDFYNELPRNLR
mgnify:CR=1 FL=1